MPRQYYLRFVLHAPDPDSPKIGAFQGAFELKRSARVSGADLVALESALDWFNANLAEPDRFSRTKSKGYYRRYTTGLSWFKPSAIEAIRRMREMAEILDRHGYAVEELKTLRPGFVTYEDDLQVVAEPFAETPR